MTRKGTAGEAPEVEPAEDGPVEEGPVEEAPVEEAPRHAIADGDADGDADGEAGRGLLTVRLGDARFGMWVDEVLEIVNTPPISRLPLPVGEVAGVTSVRGDVVPVLDLGVRLLGAPAARPGRLVLVRHQESGTIVGLLVDGVETLVPVRDAAVKEPPGAAKSRLPAELVTGVVTANEEVVTILHLGRATAPPDPTRDEG